MKQGALLLTYFWVLAGIAQFANIVSILGIAILTLPILLWVLETMET